MSQLWRSIIAKDIDNGSVKDDYTKEVVLANPKWKHKGGRGGKDKPPKKDRSHVTCYNCSKKEHFANECWNPPTGNKFAPPKRGQELGAEEVGKDKCNGGQEILLCTLTAGNILHDTDLFLLDSCATYNLTFSDRGLIIIVPAEDVNMALCAIEEYNVPKSFGYCL
jgi:Zinc knuckle